jgi:hypothetical protein
MLVLIMMLTASLFTLVYVFVFNTIGRGISTPAVLASASGVVSSPGSRATIIINFYDVGSTPASLTGAVKCTFSSSVRGGACSFGALDPPAIAPGSSETLVGAISASSGLTQGTLVLLTFSFNHAGNSTIQLFLQ